MYIRGWWLGKRVVKREYERRATGKVFQLMISHRLAVDFDTIFSFNIKLETRKRQSQSHQISSNTRINTKELSVRFRLLEAETSINEIAIHAICKNILSTIAFASSAKVRDEKLYQIPERGGGIKNSKRETQNERKQKRATKRDLSIKGCCTELYV